MEELIQEEIEVGYGVQWDTGPDKSVIYRGIYPSWNNDLYSSESHGQSVYNWLFKLAVF